MPIPARHLVQHQAKLVTVSLDTRITQALALMIEHDFSQLPVVDTDFKPLGIITTDSIARALLTLGTTVKEPRVKDAFTKPPIFHADEDLLYLLDYLLKASAVFLIDAEGKLSGIITDYDTTQYFRQRAEDIVLVEDIESTLKSHLRAVHDAVTEDSEELRAGIDSLNTTLDEIRKKAHASIKEYCKDKSLEFTLDEANLVVSRIFPSEKAKDFDSLTLGGYIQLSQKTWSKLSPIFNISKNAWPEMMTAVREIRNKLVHFRGDVSPVERAKLRYCAEWYKTHQPIQIDSSSVDEAILEATESTAHSVEEVEQTKNSPKQYEEKTRDSSRRTYYSYEYIANILNQANINHGFRDSYTLTLAVIEDMLERSLPRAAYEHITWWTENYARNRVWSKHGWVVTSANLASTKPTVTFKLLTVPASPIPHPEVSQTPPEQADVMPT